MRVLFLCAGYGTCLQKDLVEDDRWSHLAHLPKALLPVGGKALITRWMDMVDDLERVEEVVVITNNAFLDRFTEWSESLTTSKKLYVISDGTLTNETRVGAIGDLKMGLEFQSSAGEITEVLVVAGDTLFKQDFRLRDFIESFRGHGLVTECPTKEEEVHLRGIIEFDQDGLVTKLLEKPDPSTTCSRSQCPCFYLLDRSHCLQAIKDYLEMNKDEGFATRDATGNFLAHLIATSRIYCYSISGRYDIGNLKSYLECCNSF